jgi:hypothetical protein
MPSRPIFAGLECLAMVRTALIALAAAALVAAPGAARANPLAFVYKGAGCDGKNRLPRYQGVIGRKLDGVSDFFSAESWAQLHSGAEWAAADRQGRNVEFGRGRRI